MKLIALILFSFQLQANYMVSSNISRTKKWSTITSNKEVNMNILLSYLKRSKTGREIISKAQLKASKQNKELIDLLSEGDTSLTDTTLYRKFSKDDEGAVEYETKSVVTINRSLSQYDAMLDLAHELTHFVHRDEFNPYRLDFTLQKFIKSTIEETGGEVHAFMTECKVVNELFPQEVASRHNCKKITNSNNELSYKHAVEQFYSVGGYYKNLQVSLHKYDLLSEFNNISNSSIQFISSAYGVPYPVAALHEYNSVMEKVCENDLNRYAMMTSKGPSRKIASIDVKSFKKSILTRCKNYL